MREPNYEGMELDGMAGTKLVDRLTLDSLRAGSAALLTVRGCDPDVAKRYAEMLSENTMDDWHALNLVRGALHEASRRLMPSGPGPLPSNLFAAPGGVR